MRIITGWICRVEKVVKQLIISITLHNDQREHQISNILLQVKQTTVYYNITTQRQITNVYETDDCNRIHLTQ